MIDLIEIKNKIFKKENLYFLLFILIIFGADRYSKIKIIEEFNDSIVYVNNFLNFDLIWNTGIGFGILSSSTSVIYNFISIIIGTIIAFLIWISLKSDKIDKIIFSLIIGGALGNLYDRLIFKAVPDFIDMHYNNFHWFTFNIADVFISIGVIIFVLKGFLIKEKK